jgi:predicted transcriptional regulator
MKKKSAKIVIESSTATKARWKAALKGKLSSPKTSEQIISVESWDVLAKVMSPLRLQLMSLIYSRKPGSIAALAKIAKRDFKNVHEDVNILASVGFVELKKVGRSMTPISNVSGIEFSFPDLDKKAS